MHRKPVSTSLPRQKVLIVNHHDGYSEAFAEKNIDVHFARLVASSTLYGEQLAEEILAELLCPGFRDLYRRDFLRGNAFGRPLSAQTASSALSAQRACSVLSALGDEVHGGRVLCTL